ncbi:B12 binding domain/transcriptional regulator, MerR family protein [Plesiocystis pacifica SIR-1]|uniref:B12 binding domain/transcriptional regulator, MerR family protein n=1 Tax=Plesiocystis pacifica SIR-1 TaxID=391625 RepID=A6GDQ0_9BACT|nr:MerR family transcriptional regulator [Plesiocystis pacifica]EDM76025.1 B12 binding domain/transcriptional regulator, MerR family protein [Plesiocystis pacifica SIR-1]
MAMQRGKYRIQTVAEMTGVPAATLRAWERRYGIPSPERTSSSYRLFSDHDIASIRKLKELCDEGMAPAEAARMVQRIEEASNQPVEGDPYARASERIIAAIVDFDPQRLEQAVRGAMFLGSASTVFQRVLAPTMRSVGERWHDGTLSVAQEHMASEALSGAARDMLRLLEPQSSAKPAIVACFADEEHTLPLYGVAFGLLRWGLRPLVLGARTPPSAIRHAVESIRPALVGLSVTVPPPAYRARELIEGYADAAQGCPWIVGGPGSEALRAAVEASGGTVVGTRPPEEIRVAVERLLDPKR